MDETQITEMLSAFDSKLATDPQIRSILRKISSGKATFADTEDYAIRAGNLLGQLLSEEITDILPEDREVLCAALLKARHTDINDLLKRVQETQDEAQGVHLNPVKPKFPAERVQKLSHALVDPTVPPETIRRRANAPVATVAKSFHDDYIRENASIRSRLGLKPVIIRYGSNCCKWCSEVAGKYRFGEQPKGIFRRHDNCNCTIIYDNQVLRGRETSSGRSKTWEEVDPAQVEKLGFTPTINSHEQAKEIEREQLEFMSNSFRPAYSQHQSTFRFGSTNIPVYRVQNSQFNMYTDTADRRSKAVRTVEKLLRHIQSKLPDGFELPPVLVVDFDKFGLNVDSNGNVHDVIGGFAPESGILYMNPHYDTPKKILEFVTKNKGRFANQTEYAPVLHELGHKFYEDSVKRLAISGEMSYNEAKNIIDSRIFDYIKDRNTDGRFVLNNISGYADKGYGKHSYTEIIAECFSVLDSNQTAGELLRLLEG